MEQNPHFAAFRQLHQQGLLVLANAWDAGSARLIESLGAKAIATTSAGVAWSNGYADGDVLPVPRLLSTLSGILDAIRVPLSADIEGGYSDDPDAVADLAARLSGMGIAGINLEDGQGSPRQFCAKIEAIKRACARSGTELFINARTDVYLRGLAPAEKRVEETLERARLYHAAGADGLFVPGISARNDIEAVVAGTPLPLNVLARASLPGSAELESWGVRRLSAGSDIAESTYRCIEVLARGFFADGISSPLSANAMPYPALNALFARDRD